MVDIVNDNKDLVIPLTNALFEHHNSKLCHKLVEKYIPSHVAAIATSIHKHGFFEIQAKDSTTALQLLPVENTKYFAVVSETDDQIEN